MKLGRRFGTCVLAMLGRFQEILAPFAMCFWSAVFGIFIEKNFCKCRFRSEDLGKQSAILWYRAHLLVKNVEREHPYFSISDDRQHDGDRALRHDLPKRPSKARNNVLLHMMTGKLMNRELPMVWRSSCWRSNIPIHLCWKPETLNSNGSTNLDNTRRFHYENVLQESVRTDTPKDDRSYCWQAAARSFFGRDILCAVELFEEQKHLHKRCLNLWHL